MTRPVCASAMNEELNDMARMIVKRERRLSVVDVFKTEEKGNAPPPGREKKTDGWMTTATAGRNEARHLSKGSHGLRYHRNVQREGTKASVWVFCSCHAKT